MQRGLAWVGSAFFQVSSTQPIKQREGGEGVLDEPRVEHGFDFVTGKNPLDDLLGFFPVWILDPLAVSAHIGTGVMGTDPVGGIKAREGEELGWGVPRFFQEFAPGGSVGLFAVLKPARRKLPMGFAVRGTDTGR